MRSTSLMGMAWAIRWVEVLRDSRIPTTTTEDREMLQAGVQTTAKEPNRSVQSDAGVGVGDMEKVSGLLSGEALVHPKLNHLAISVRKE